MFFSKKVFIIIFFSQKNIFTKNIYRDPSILPSLFGTSGVIMSSTSWLLGTSLVSGTWKVKLVEVNRLSLFEFIKTGKDDVLSKPQNGNKSSFQIHKMSTKIGKK